VAEVSRPLAAKAGGSAPLNPVRLRSTSSISGSQRRPSRLIRPMHRNRICCSAKSS
jgi:hypothetical protein